MGVSLSVNSVGVSRNSSARRAKLNMITHQEKDYKRSKFFFFPLFFDWNFPFFFFIPFEEL